MCSIWISFVKVWGGGRVSLPGCEEHPLLDNGSPGWTSPVVGQRAIPDETKQCTLLQVLDLDI